MNDDDTNPMDIDADAPLSKEERAHIRRVLRDDDRATWARKQLRVLLPIAVTLAVGLWQFGEWVTRHFKP